MMCWRLVAPRHTFHSFHDRLHFDRMSARRRSPAGGLREFGALSIEEAAEILGMYTATVERQWSTARAWLRRELSR